MDEGTWGRLRAIFEGGVGLARAEREDYLDRECGTDDDLRRRVRQLFEADDRRPEHLEPPDLARLQRVGSTTLLNVGRRIGAYALERVVGRGGVGTVYLAHRVDASSVRVAVKLLRRGMDTDDVLRRFRNERQVLADLDHPGIARLIDGGATDDGLPYLVMEYVEGERLDRFCDDRCASVRERVRLFVGVCDAVEHAHRSHVVHRDLKAGNILVTPDGSPKLLDFGIAKLLDPSGAMQTKEITATELRMMTPESASPEQVRGEKVSPATDVYGLGVLLFELLTSHQVFAEAARSQAELVARICSEDPERPSAAARRPLAGDERPCDRRGTTTSRLRAELRGELDTICLKALRKDPKDRYPAAGAMGEDLRRWLEGRPILARPDGPGRRATRYLRRRKGLVGSIVGALLLLGLAGVLVELGSVASSRTIGQTERLTSGTGLEHQPVWSPDGELVAYAADHSGQMDVWVLRPGSSEPMLLSGDHPGWDGSPAWSPDGRTIAFVSDREGGGIFLVPSQGGAHGRLVGLVFVPSFEIPGSIPTISWSPDGERLAYAFGLKQNRGLYVVALDGGVRPRRVPLPESAGGFTIGEPAWSPSGKRLAFTEYTGTGATVSRIWTLAEDGSEASALTEGEHLDHNPVWSADGRRIYFVSDRGGSPDVWWVPLEGERRATAPPRALTAGVGVGSMALSPDGEKLVYSRLSERSNVWKAPYAKDGLITLSSASPIAPRNQQVEFVNASADRLAFDSNRTGNMDIWVMHTDGSDPIQVTHDEAHDWHPTLSPDADWVTFHSIRDGNREIYKASVTGGRAVRLTEDSAKDWLPAWSPDGSEIAFVSDRAGNQDVWIVSARGGDPRQLTQRAESDHNPRWSPDGTHIVFASSRGDRDELFLIERDGSELRRLTGHGWFDVVPLLWTDEGLILAWGRGGGGAGDVGMWRVRADDGSVERLLEPVHATKRVGVALAVARGSLYFPIWESVGDLWLAELSP